MTLQTAFSVENNFRNGRVTEATGLNFPENACTDELNCVFQFKGNVIRRPGFDFEDQFTTKQISRDGNVNATYLWKNILGDGSLSLVVKQVGPTLYFYEVTGSTSVSAGAVVSTITLTPVSGAPGTGTVECQFTSGNGKLFVTHPYIDPIYVTYDFSSHTATATTTVINIRDDKGDLTDNLAVDNRPTATRTSISKAHLYNLYNQGWNLTNLTAWDTGLTTMPSNCDVMWRFKNSSDAFATSTVPNVVTGNSPAPKGHYIFPLALSTRNTQVSTDDGTTVTTVVEDNTSYWRPATCAFYAGRVFYSAIKYTGYESNIYFTQIVERDDQYGLCYQKNDPTSEDVFDLLPDDGGVVRIPDAGQIIKLFAMPAGLVVFAQRGVWIITGSTGLGFTADDYTIQKISSVVTNSPSSFVDIAGGPAWWTTEAIYMLQSDQNGQPTVKSITLEKVQAYYDDIPVTAKLGAKGCFNYITNVVQWLYNTNAASDPNVDYNYTNILNINMLTGAFYVWDIPTATVTINDIILLDGTAGTLAQLDVIDDSANTVQDDSGNNVVTFQASNSGTTPTISYIVSYPNSGSNAFTFASARNLNYLDWLSFDGFGQDFDSFFISGFKLRGQAIKKWQPCWLRIFSNNNEMGTAYTIRGLWDYSLNETTNRWNIPQTVTHPTGEYGTVSKRLKMRGHGLALQFKVTSLPGQPFDISGWTEFSTGNSIP